jgi:formylglycine-generating enzyme required for sulfatase activity
MTKSFTPEAWNARVAAWWRENARDWKETMARLGVNTAYGLLTASAFLPLLEVYGQAPGPAVAALSGIVSNVGTELLSNLVQGAYDKVTAPRTAEEEIAEQPALRAEYQRMLAALDVHDAAQAALGEQWADFEAQLATELQRMGGRVHVETEGAAVVFGDVTVSHGDFVGRDKNIYINQEKSPTDLLRAYYRSVANECRHLPLGIVDPKFTQPASEGEVALHQVYVNLDVVAPVRAADEDKRAWGLRLARGEGEGRTSLLEALAEPEAARVVLLGDPGSGKTTFINYLTYHLAAAVANDKAADLPDALKSLWPVRLILREVASYLPPDECGSATLLWDAVRADVMQRLGESAVEQLMPYLQEHVLSAGGLFLLDGLDEVPEAGRRRRCLLEAVQGLIECLPTTGRVLLTARPYAYADPKWQLADLPMLALAPFNEGQTAHFVDRWYQAVRPAMGWSPQEAKARGERLSNALQERPRLGDLASRPLLLTLMATLHTSWGQLPEDRANLYEESVKLLLARWQRAREVRTSEGEREQQPGLTAALGVTETTVRTALEQLAYEAHCRQGKTSQHRDAPADVPAGEVLVVFSPLLPDNINPQKVLTYLETRAGLLLGRREQIYAFLHRSFQEYLAACHLANTERDFGGKLRELIWEDLDWWREVFLSGVGKKRQGGLGDAVNVVNALVPEGPEIEEDSTETHWRAATLAGEALLDLDLVGETTGRPHYRALLKRVRRWLVALVEEGHLKPRERVTAGDVLGKLGDPRPGVGAFSPPRGGEEPGVGLPNILWVKIPEGPFLMGSTADDPDAYDDEKPQHELTLPTYHIARYPVTNAQFRPFVEGDGYENPTYWTEQGWAWRQGAEPDLSPLDDLQDEEWKQQYKDWLAQRTPEKRNCPFWWDHPRLGVPTRPVVGITWFEAVAYTRWLKERLKVTGCKLKVWRDGEIVTENVQLETCNVQLPSEAEWEKAARGADGRRYPWGDAWQEEHGNIEETGIEETNPVGSFPQGLSPYGVLEMSGNVWEWTRSRWGERSVTQPDYVYPYEAADGRERLQDMKIPILRGGSWDLGQRDAQRASRDWVVPDFFDADFGFRVVVSLVRF